MLGLGLNLYLFCNLIATGQSVPVSVSKADKYLTLDRDGLGFLIIELESESCKATYCSVVL
jgi:hypothetical protein